MEKQELYEMCKSIIDLNKQRYVIIIESKMIQKV